MATAARPYIVTLGYSSQRAIAFLYSSSLAIDNRQINRVQAQAHFTYRQYSKLIHKAYTTKVTD